MGWGAFAFRLGCARARVTYFFYYFFTIMVVHHTISKNTEKEVWPNSGARADPKVLPSQWRFSVGAQARGSQWFFDLGGAVIRPWGQRASQIRVRARADYFLFFILF